MERLEARELLTLAPGPAVAVSATAGALLQGEIGTFTDSDPADAPSGFTVSINWGDGTAPDPTTGRVVADGVNGFDVSGAHTYSTSGTDDVTAFVTAPDGSTARVLGTATVSDAPITVVGLDFDATSGAPAAVNVADFQVANPSAMPGEYLATINWGDGGPSSTSTTFSPDGQGGYMVSASHTYASPGSFTTTVSLQHATGTATASGGGTATVAAPSSLGPISQLILGTPDLPIDANTQVVGSFRDFVYDPANPSAFQASINWGDGHVTAGKVTLVSTAAGASGTTALYNVTGSNVYQSPGTYLVTSSVQDLTGQATVIKSTAIISGPVLTPLGTTFAATAGLPSPASTRVATFFDTNTADFAPGSMPLATIAWGDGQTTVGAVVVGSQAGTFDVRGGHTYSTAGTFAVGVTLVNDAGQTASASSSAVVSAAAINATGTTFPVTPGVPFTDALVATFSDDNPEATAANLAATIHWGDGHTTPGTITGPDASGLFSVEGSFTYLGTTPTGSYPVSVTITDPSGLSATATSQAVIVDAPTIVAIGMTVAVSPGVPFSGVVATFTDSNPAAKTTEPTALISFGDGHVAQGTVAGPDANGLFTVSGTNLYAPSASGSFPVSVTITDPSGQTATASSTAVASAQSATAVGVSFAASPGVPFTGTVATFTDTSPSASTTRPIAAINWGDGTSSAGTVGAPDANGVFTVTGTHAYAAASPSGSYPVTVTITDPSSHVTLAVGSAVVTAPAPVATVPTGSLDLGGEDGPSAAAGFSDTNRPTFSGTASPFAIVQLVARRDDIDATLPLGRVIAGPDGHWALATGPLSEGILTVTAIATPAGGAPSAPTLLANNGQVVIDTTPPVAIGATSYAGKSRIVVAFRDGLSGLSTQGLGNAANYTLVGPRGAAIHPASVSLLAGGGLPTDPQGVVLTINASPRVLRGLRYLRIAALSIRDNAGNSLGKDFQGTILPSRGHASGNSVLKFAR